MKHLFTLLFITVIFSSSQFAQQVFTDDFSSGINGWLTLSDEDWSFIPTIESEKCYIQFSGATQKGVALMSPIGAVGDFTFEFSGQGTEVGADITGFIGVSAEGNVLEYHVLSGDTLQLVTGNMIANDYDVLYESPVDASDGAEHIMKIDVSTDLPTTTITIWWDGLNKGTFTLTDVEEAETYGQVGFFAYGSDVEMYFDDVTINYTPLSAENPYTEDFNDGHAEGWLGYSNNDWDIWPVIEDNACHINYTAGYERTYVLFSPVGAMDQFSFETKGKGGNATATGIVGLTTSGDFIEYHVIEGDFIELVTGTINEPDVEEHFEMDVNASDGEYHTMKLMITGEAPNITISAWWDDTQVYTEEFTDAPIDGTLGNFGVFTYGDEVDMWFDDIIVENLSNNGIDNIQSNNNTIELHQNYPNPFSSDSEISYYIPEKSFVNISVYDITGKLIQNIVNEKQRSGNHSVKVFANKFAPGLYYYQLNTGKEKRTKKCIVIE